MSRVFAHRIDPSGYFLEDVFLYPTTGPDGAEVEPQVPSDHVTERPPGGMQWPRWVDGAWVDGGSPFVVDADGTPIIPTEE